MTKATANDNNLQDTLEKIIKKIQSIQKDIRASGQPASLREIQQLENLGNEYAQVIKHMERLVEKNDK